MNKVEQLCVEVLSKAAVVCMDSLKESKWYEFLAALENPGLILSVEKVLLGGIGSKMNDVAIVSSLSGDEAFAQEWLIIGWMTGLQHFDNEFLCRGKIESIRYFLSLCAVKYARVESGEVP